MRALKWEQKTNTDNSKPLGAIFISNIHFRSNKLDSIILLIKAPITKRSKMGRAHFCQLENSQLESTKENDRKYYEYIFMNVYYYRRRWVE